jgi:Protein required for attachment to host cells
MGKVCIPRGFEPKLVNHWYLVANRAEAVVYAGNLGGQFRYVKRWRNQKGRLFEREFQTDRPGRSFSSARSGVRHGFEPRVSAHEEVAVGFARHLSRMLDLGAQKGAYSDLVIVAEPHFLGLLNKGLTKRVKDLVRQSVCHEWKRGSDRELGDFLRKKLA